MKKELIVTAKTVDEAKEKAASELGVAIENIEFTVLEEGKRGFLGIGATDAKISATYTLGGADIALAFIEQVVKDMELSLTVAKKEGNNDDILLFVKSKTIFDYFSTLTRWEIAATLPLIAAFSAT